MFCTLQTPATARRPQRPCRLINLVVLLLFLLPAQLAARSASAQPATPPLPAFPGAEGFGAAAVGGRGGQVIAVTNLNDSGPGSLRAALEGSGPRTVIFTLGGVIKLSSPLKITQPYITIAGQTAPGDGITITGHFLSVQSHDVIIRYLRLRQTEDGLNLVGGNAYNIVIDHVTSSWGKDENMSTYASSSAETAIVRDVTFQSLLLAEGLLSHSKGLLLGNSTRLTVYKSLFVHNEERNPRCQRGQVDVAYTVVYNHGNTAVWCNSAHGAVQLNYIGNTIIPGPSTRLDRPDVLLEGSTVGYFAQNTGMKGTLAVSGRTTSTRFPSPLVTPATVEEVLTQAGDSAALTCTGEWRPRRDAIDQRVVQDVRDRTGRLISTVPAGGIPPHAAGTPCVDSDRDGMPDAYEQRAGFDPANPLDGNQDGDGDGYTNIEAYLNGAPTTSANQPPVVAAGADQTITLPATAELRGTVQDDGLPANQLLTQWSLVYGPDMVSFNNVNTLTATASFRVAGIYTVRLVANDGQLSTIDTVTITVNPSPSANRAPTVLAGEDTVVAVDSTLPLRGSVTDDGLPDGQLTLRWSSLNGPGTVTFGNATLAETVAGFSAPGLYTLQLQASDGQLSSVDTLLVTVTPVGGSVTTVQIRVAASEDDAEQQRSGKVNLTSSDLELVTDSDPQLVGMRFRNVTIPKGAIITSAYLQFQTDESGSNTTTLQLQGQASDNAPLFAKLTNNLSDRPRTAAMVNWTPAPWPTVGAAGADQRTPNLAAVVQEIVNRPGWQPGNAIVLLISGAGKRTAEAYDGVSAAAALLLIEYR